MSSFISFVFIFYKCNAYNITTRKEINILELFSYKIYVLCFSFSMYSHSITAFFYCIIGMNKRKSQKKFNGEILLMQTELMSKLALANDSKKQIDELGFSLQK